MTHSFFFFFKSLFLESVCEDASSFELKPEIIANSISECDECIFMMSSDQNTEGAIGGIAETAMSEGISVERIQMLRCVLATFELKISEVRCHFFYFLYFLYLFLSIHNNFTIIYYKVNIWY